MVVRVMLALALLLALSGCQSLAPAAGQNCHSVAWMPGPEDIELDESDPTSPRLIVSSFERRHDAGDGRIVSVPLAARGFGEPRPFKLQRRGNSPFAPHGISLVSTPAGPRLYVINHLSESEHAVEVFIVHRDHLEPAGPPLTDALLFAPNDLVALPDGQVYVTNTGASSLWEQLGLLFGQRRGNVVHFKDGQWRVVAEHIGFANGIAVDRSGAALYVAGFADKAIHVFRREPQTGAIGERVRSIEVGSGVDNLTWADDDTLIVAAHPSLLAMARHRASPTRRAPSEVYRVNVRRDESPTLIYSDPGTVVSAASTGIVRKGWLYLGQVFDPQVVGCPLP
jgi:arylesterase/paraoxonase